MPFLRNVPGLETVYRDYAPKGVQFLIVYKSIVHPGTNGFVDAFTKEERLQQLAIAKQRLGTTVPMISDSLDGDIVSKLHSAPNAEFVIDTDGKIVHRKFWHDPAALRDFLTERVGKVDKPTRVEDLGMKLHFPKPFAPRGLVKPTKMPRAMKILRSKPIINEGAKATPFFAKLLVEGDRALLRGKPGKLYIGFYLDPVYQVHWNNPAGGLSFTIDDPNSDEFEPITKQAPTYQHEADVDPREFLFEFAPASKEQKLQLTVRYTICDDNGKFCMPVEQQYEVQLRSKPGGASRAGVWMTELVGNPMQWDKNGDGKASRDELPKKRAQIILLHFDHNHDDAIDQQEAAQFLDMIRMQSSSRELDRAKQNGR